MACPRCGGTVVAYQESYSNFAVDATGRIGTKRVDVLELPDQTYAVCTNCSCEYSVVYDADLGAERVDLEHPLQVRRPAARHFSDEFKLRIVAAATAGDTEILAKEAIPRYYVARWLASIREGKASRKRVRDLERENARLRQRMQAIETTITAQRCLLSAV